MHLFASPFFLCYIKNVIINKEFNKKIAIEYFFIHGVIDIDSDYFINKIKNGITNDDNMNFKTNVKSPMTSWHFFNKDLKFNIILSKLIEYVDSYYNFNPYVLAESWGIEMRQGQKTNYHDHQASYWSGVLYLNESEQLLKFPDINQEVKPGKGVFALFSPFLKHGCSTNYSDEPKYGISFNMREVKNWD